MKSARRFQEDWNRAGAALRRLDPDEFNRIFALVEGFVSIHEPTLEDRETFNTRLAEIAAQRGSA